MTLLHDSIGRRKRETPQSSGKRFKPTARALTIMEKLHRHGPLPSSFLHAYCEREGFRSEGRTLDALTHLFNEDNTPHQGRYLERPWQQFDTFDARYHELMYDVREPALAALDQHGRLFPNTPETASDHWKHDTFLAAVTASIELAVLLEPEKYEYIFHDEIVTRLGRFSFPIGEINLKPDRSFGIKYKATGGVRLFLIEADRSTEPNKVRKQNRKTHERAIDLYLKFIGQGEYKKYFPQGTRLMLIHIFASQAKMQHVREMTGNSAFTLFQHWSNFSRYFIPPKPRLDLFTGPYQRAGQPDFYISQATQAEPQSVLSPLQPADLKIRASGRR
jgi:hypothetical protein